MRIERRRRTPRAAQVGAALLSLALCGVGALMATPAGAGGAPNPAPNDPADVALPSGVYIIDTGSITDPATAQTADEGLAAYGLVHALIRARIPVQWVIEPDKDSGTGAVGTAEVSQTVGNVGVDFTFDCDGDGPDAAKDYRTGAFVIPAEFGAQAASLVDTWRTNGAIVDGPCTSPTPTLPLYAELTSWPVTVIENDGSDLVAAFFDAAQIPQGSLVDPANPPAYRLVTSPADLTNCDDFYAMPHATVGFETHSPLIDFVTNGGSLWASCDGVSQLENLRYPPEYPDPDLQNTLATNFLTTDGLLTSHANGSTPYSYFVDPAEGTAWSLDPLDSGDPVAQFRGVIDGATTNGTEQIYLPSVASAWRPATQVVVYDPTQSDVPANSPGPAAALVYGPAYGDSANGDVMYIAGHDLTTGSPDDVAAQRAFFNMLLLTQVDPRGAKPSITVPATSTTVGSGDDVTVDGTATGGSGGTTFAWESTCFDQSGNSVDAGVFADPTLVATSFAAPAVTSRTHCNLVLVATDDCGHVMFTTRSLTVLPVADVAVTKTGPGKVRQTADVTYTIVVTNNGAIPGTTSGDGVEAAGVALSDDIPAGMTFVSVSDPVFSGTAPIGVSCGELNGSVSCELGDMADEQTATIEIVLTAPDSSGLFSNVANIDAESGDPDPTNDSATQRTRVIDPGIMLVVTTDLTEVSGALGGDVVFTFTVTNTGDDLLRNVVVSNVPDDCFIVGPTGDSNADQRLDISETWVYTCNRLIDATTEDATDDYDPATKRSLATVVARDRTGATVTDSDDVTVTVLVPPPTGTDDIAVVSRDSAIVLDPLDNDPTTPLVLWGITQPAHGDAVLLPDQTVRYTPTPGYVGIDVFTYTACDVFERCIVQVVTITVAELPTVGSDTSAITEIAWWIVGTGAALVLLTLRRRRART